MPTVPVNDIDIYYEEHGSGEPLLLIMGWGGNAATWRPQIPGLAERFRVIAFDNRGVGRTSAPGNRYSIAQMAQDAAQLLEVLGLPRAHVFGVSMGGMIAQELALTHPDKVGALVLGCTWAGGDRAPGAAELRSQIANFRKNTDRNALDLEWFSGFLRHLWTDQALTQSHTHLQDFVLALIRFPPSHHGLRQQAAAIARHDAHDRLHQIDHPTLVITGSEDSLIDPRNSQILTEGIPRSELGVFHGLKHAFHLERPDLVNAAIVDFIEQSLRHDGRSRRRPSRGRKRGR